MILGQHILALAGLVLFFSWQGIAIAFMAWLFYYAYGMILGFHRIFAHGTFNISRASKLAMLLSGSLSGMGSSVGWVGQHRAHHAHADDPEKDPYWSKFTFVEKFKAWFTYPVITKFKLTIIKDLLKDKDHMFFHKHYYKILLVWVVALSLVSFETLVYFWALPNVLTYTALTLVGVLGHNLGSQTVSDKHQGRDSHILSLFTLGESYQNKHHVSPSEPIQGLVDPIGYVSYPFFKK
jgi:stearoyl-CoA desaturase (delta-9 desaturase)